LKYNITYKEVVITTAGNLPAKFVIHAVGRVWNSGSKNNEENLLSLAYTNSAAYSKLRRE